MRKTSTWIIAGLGLFLLLFTSAYADEGGQKEAEALLETMHMDTVLSQAIDQVMNIQARQNPSIAPYRHIMEQFMKKYMSYESLKPDLIKLYTQTFTKEELSEITGFYRTSTGQKVIQVMPQLMAQGAQMGQARVQEHLPELQQQIKEEADRLNQAHKQQDIQNKPAQQR
ncbi:MAG: DUF2059 domain-containing protein [Proteobacteria bacterium]|nr:DUF2059 domain-containing protein [Pseudomonadota bacterium]